ncbi:hypothetical protein A2U01_0094259, partial [Trifolium medium]|nr:hypothetical protein [Trifolium medium]
PRPFSRPEPQNLDLLAERGMLSLSESIAIDRHCSPVLASVRCFASPAAR